MFTRAAILLTLALSACTASDAATPPSQAQAQPAAAAPDLCVPVFQRARACTAQWIPALVDARAAVDHPAGIADAVHADRANVIAMANAEWASDSQDANISEMCAAHSPTETSADRTASVTCLAKSDCDAFTACEMPVIARHFGK